MMTQTLHSRLVTLFSHCTCFGFFLVKLQKVWSGVSRWLLITGGIGLMSPGLTYGLMCSRISWSDTLNSVCNN